MSNWLQRFTLSLTSGDYFKMCLLKWDPCQEGTIIKGKPSFVINQLSFITVLWKRFQSSPVSIPTYPLWPIRHPQGWQTNSVCLHDRIPPCLRHPGSFIQHCIFSMPPDEQVAIKLARELSAAFMVSFSEIRGCEFRLLGGVTVWLFRENGVTIQLFW